MTARDDASETPRLEKGSVRLGEALAQAGLAASDIARKAEAARQTAGDTAEALEGWIRARPLTSVLLGAAIGYLFARIASR
jgi:hypothetical protein